MDNPLELIGEAVQGDIEIAGHRIPKIALIGGGAALIVVLILLSRRGGSRGAISSASLPTDAGTGSGITPIGESGGGVGGADTGTPGSALEELSASFAQQLQDQSASLADLIAQNNSQQANDLNSQLGAVYDQLASVGSSLSPGFSDQYSSVPADYSGYGMPIDSGSMSYPVSSGLDLSSYQPHTTNPVSNRLQIGASKIKPTAVKPQGGTPKAIAKLGSALKPSKSGSDKVALLSPAKPKGDKPSVGILNFDKKQPINLGTPNSSGVLNKMQKQPATIASKVPVVSNQKGKVGVLANARNITSSPQPVAIPVGIKTFMASGISKTGKIPQAAKPASIAKKPSGVTAQPKPKTINNRPVFNYPKPAPIPVYQPPVVSFTNPFRTLPNYGKVSHKVNKKAR